MNNLLRFLLLIALGSCTSAPSDQPGQVPLPRIDTARTKSPVPDVQDHSDLLFTTYCNDRFGYCIDYPVNIFYPQPESPNGDGRVFTNQKGDERLRVFGRNNDLPEQLSLAQQYEQDLHPSGPENTSDRVITYQKLGKTFFVISGYQQGKIFYQKTILKDNAFAYAILQYDKTEGPLLDKIAEVISESFK